MPNVPGIFSIPLNPILEISKNLNNKNIILVFIILFSSSNNGIEKIPGVFGILFDDIIGGIYTIPIIYLVLLWFGKI